jgi:AcrR family transcriptional regulator
VLPEPKVRMASPNRGRGRPRSSAVPASDTPEEDILRAAGRIFAEKGFAGSSTREIAEAAGLRGPSIFHYFPTKEDILRALADRALIRPLEVLEDVRRSPARPAVKLYVVTRFQAEHFCSEPYDLTPVVRDAFSLPRDRFQAFYEAADRYSGGMKALVQEGITQGEFVEEDAGLATMSILGSASWTLRWYRKDGPISAAQVAETFARLALRSLLCTPDMLPTVIAESESITIARA